MHYVLNKDINLNLFNGRKKKNHGSIILNQERINTWNKKKTFWKKKKKGRQILSVQDAISHHIQLYKRSLQLNWVRVSDCKKC